jgi:hypothetical protein
VLDHAGLGDVADRVLSLGEEGKRAEARKVIEAEVLDHVGVVIGDAFEPALARWAPLVDRVALGVPWYGMDAPAQLAYCRKLIEFLVRAG